MYNFACVCYGDKYSPEYVQKLYNMVERNTTIDYKFYCFTDLVKIHKQVEGNITFQKMWIKNIRQYVKGKKTN